METKALVQSEKKIDLQNQANWNKRYENPNEIIERSVQLLKLTDEIPYKKGWCYAKLNIAACKFLLSLHSENIISDLYEIIHYFEKQEPEPGYVNALNLAANIFQSYGDYKKGLELCKKAQKIALKLNNEEILSDNYSICGLIYSDLFDYANAIDHFKKALDLRSKSNNKKAMASSLNLIARTNSLSGNYTEALSYYHNVLTLREEINDIGGLPWTHIGLASTYETINNLDASVKHYEQALKLNEKYKDKRCNLHCYLGMGIVKSNTNALKGAEDYLFKALDIARSLNSISHLYQIHKVLADLYEKMREVPKAFENYKLYHTYQNQVMNTELQNSLKKQEIIFAIEKSKKEAEIYRLKHIELKKAYEEVEIKNTEILDSITYAKSIQIALLPSDDYIKEVLPERFILFKPRDIVSGDFYWINKVDENIIVAAADCTGHGVPGAFMSMLGISFLNEIVNKNKTIQPDLILNELRNMVINSLNKSENQIKDGMDIALIRINIKTLELEYAGAYNPLLIFRKNPGNEEIELIEFKANRMPVGKYFTEEEPFTNNQFQIQKDDTIYMFSDGYQDQFGGEKGFKFKTKRFKELLMDIHKKTMLEQKVILEQTLKSWQGKYLQVDDIIVIGLRF